MAAQWAQHAGTFIHNAGSLLNHAQAALQPFAAVALSRVDRTQAAKAVGPPIQRVAAAPVHTQQYALFQQPAQSAANDASVFAVTAISTPKDAAQRRTQSGGLASGVFGGNGTLALRRLFPPAVGASHLHTQAGTPGLLSGDLSYRQQQSPSPFTHAAPPTGQAVDPLSAFSAFSGDEVAQDSDGTLEEDRYMLQQQAALSSGGNLSSSEGHSRLGARPAAPMSIGRSLGASSLKPSYVAPRGRAPRVLPASMADSFNMPAAAAVAAFTGTDAENAQMQHALNEQYEHEFEMEREMDLDADEEHVEEEDDAMLAETAHAHDGEGELRGASSAQQVVGEEEAAISNVDILKFFADIANPEKQEPRVASKYRMRSMPHDPALFFQTRERTLVNCNDLIRVCVAKGLYDEGVAVVERDMRPYGIEPDEATFISLICLCKAPTPSSEEKAARLEQAFRWMEEVKARFGGKPCEALWNALVDVVARLDSLDRADEVIKLMRAHGSQPSCITYTELIHQCRRVGTPAAIERAVKYFEHMQHAHPGSSLEPDTQTYNAMLRLAGLSAKGTAYAIKLFGEMQEKRYLPTIYTYSNLIYACSKSPQHYTDAFEYFSAALAQGFKPTTSLFNILLSACAVAGKGDLANALGLFRMMDKQGIQRDTASYNAMLNVLAESQLRGDRVPLIAPKDAETPVPEHDMVDKGKRIEMAQNLLVQMEQTHVPITLQTVNCAVKVSARALRLNNTPKMQEALLQAHGFEANFHSHKMLVEMYTAANRLDRALERVAAMRAAGHTAPRSLYRDMLKKVAKPKKSMETAEAEHYGQKIMQHMKEDGHTPRPEDERLFDAQKYGAYLHERNEAQLQRDTVKTGVLHSFSQRADAMLRPGDRRTGSGRTGHQSDRHAANPALAKHKQKRSQRAADAKDKAQGLNPVKRREQAIAAGHYYD